MYSKYGPLQEKNFCFGRKLLESKQFLIEEQCMGTLWKCFLCSWVCCSQINVFSFFFFPSLSSFASSLLYLVAKSKFIGAHIVSLARLSYSCASIPFLPLLLICPPMLPFDDEKEEDDGDEHDYCSFSPSSIVCLTFDT